MRRPGDHTAELPLISELSVATQMGCGGELARRLLGDEAATDEVELLDILRGRGTSTAHLRGVTAWPCEGAFAALGLLGVRLGVPSRGATTLSHHPVTLYHGGPRGSGRPVMARSGWAAVAVLAVDLLEHRAHLPPPYGLPVPPELAAMATRVLAEGGVYWID